MRTSRMAKRVAKIAAALAFLVACNAAITFVLEPYGSISEIEWREYKQLDELDTLFIGSSYVQQGIDPAQLDEACATASFCLGTPQQRLEESFVGIRTAYRDHGIKRLVLGVSPSAFTDSAPPSPNTAYLKQWRRYASSGPAEGIGVATDMLLRQNAISVEESINCLFPWKNYHVTLRPANIANNLRNKIGQIDLVEAALTIEDHFYYTGRGHGASDYRLDYNWGAATPFDTIIGNDLDKIDGRFVAPQRERTLREICQFCADNGIQMMVIMLPMPTYNIIDEESSYWNIMDAIQGILADYNVPFFDFNLLDSDYFEPEPHLFSESTHLNIEGCRLFTDVFARFFDDWMAGRSTDGYFVSRAEAIERVDSVSALFAEGVSTGDAIEVDCRAIAGPDVDVEYQLCRYVGTDIQQTRWSIPLEAVDDWEPVTDWGSSPLLTWTPETAGTYELRAYARTVGSQAPFERFRDVTVVY